MIKQTKRKKIYYVPGMISLVCIPLFCVGYFFYSGAFIEYTLIGLGMPEKGDFEKYNVVNLRKYKEFNFDKKVTQKDLKLFEVFLKETIKNGDTINGAKVNLGNRTNYQTFINVLDILSVNDASSYGLFNDSFYILGASNKPKKVKDEKEHYRMNCGTGEYMAKMQLRELELKREEEKRQFKISFFKDQKLLFGGYFALVFINIFALVKFNKNKFLIFTH